MPTRPRTLAVHVQLSSPLPEGDASLVVVGAHHFGRDLNDPLYAAVREHTWASVLLIEASPAVVRKLREQVSGATFPRVGGENMSVIGEGVCPDAGEATTRPFYSFTATVGLPHWSTMIGSFERAHVTKHIPWLLQMAKGGNWTRGSLMRQIRATPVVCRSLAAILRRHSISRPSVLLIDAEGYDCKIVASTDWCAVQPSLLVFERTHCSADDFISAQQRLRGVGLRCSSPRWRLIGQTKDNLFFRIATDERDMVDLVPLDRWSIWMRMLWRTPGRLLKLVAGRRTSVDQ